ncbi:hypothetical protein D9M71_128640 [compost metagenome]
MSTPIAVLKNHLNPPATANTGQVVERVGERGFLINRGPQRQVCNQAFSCLVAPAAGDRVLLADVDGEAFILAVLERPGSERPTIRLPDGLDIDCASELRITGTALELAPQALRVRASELDC